MFTIAYEDISSARNPNKQTKLQQTNKYNLHSVFLRQKTRTWMYSVTETVVYQYELNSVQNTEQN